MENIKFIEILSNKINNINILFKDIENIKKLIENNSLNASFITKLPQNFTNFSEFQDIDYFCSYIWCLHLLKIIDYQRIVEFQKGNLDYKPRKDRSNHYDLYDFILFIELNKNYIQNINFNLLNEIKNLYIELPLDEIKTLKNIRDKHIAHLDKDFLIPDFKISDLFFISQKIENIYYKLLSVITNDTLKVKQDLNYFEIKLKSFKYDLIMWYLNNVDNVEIDKILKIQNIKDFESSWKTITSYTSE